MGYQRVSELHHIFFSMLLVATLHACLGAQNWALSCHDRERLALLEFKHSVKDDFRLLSSWVGTNCCSWKGVRCDGATGSVVSLHLRGTYKGGYSNYVEEDNCLVGYKVNPSLAELKHLKHLDLSGNNFRGSLIPEFIGSFKQLSYLNLSSSCFRGNIPHHIGNLSNLKVLDLGTHSYSVPALLDPNDMAWVSGLSSLEYLDLRKVRLRQTKNIGMVLYKNPLLTYLSLQDCQLSNVDLGFPQNSSNILPNIKHLDLSLNYFEGQLPRFLVNLTSLKFLDISSFNLSQSWNSLNLLNMIPSLLELHMSSCGLTNAFLSPTYFNFTAHSNIQYLDISKNSFEGRFPSEFMNMTSLRVLDLSQNGLNSSIPVMFNLLKLDVSFNKFEHIEHVGIWRQYYLKELHLECNHFEEKMISPSTNMSQCPQFALEKLYLDGNKIKGTIPKSLGRLTNLRVLSLSSNSLSGSIPKALASLRSLEDLDLSDNYLTGPIPTFLGRFTGLYLSENKFCGSIPESLGRLAGLTKLSLDSNELTGPIPSSIGRLASLRELSLSSNLLNGTIPASIGQLSKLAILDMSNNSLEGVVLESHFAKLSALTYLDTTSNDKLLFNISHEWIPPFQLTDLQLRSCKIANGFPLWLQTQRKLDLLGLSNTSLYGLLPTWLRNMSTISYLDVSHNTLGGSLINLPFRYPMNGINVESEVNAGDFLFLQDNLFNGSIPRSVICRRTPLVLLDISRNKLSGSIPDCVENLQGMVVLMLSSNELSGVLPNSLGHVSSLEWLKLDDNNFNGELPYESWNLNFLKVLDLGNNDISGNIPKWIGERLAALRVLRLHKNNFTGRIPQSLCKCSNVHILDLAHNNLNGSIPRCFGELSGMIKARNDDDIILAGDYDGNSDVTDVMNVIQIMKGSNLEYTKTLYLVFNMDLSSNKLTGEIPPEIMTLVLLVGLNVSHNHLTGRIPESIGNMKALNSLDLSNNQFTGMIPPSMATLNFLSFINFSNNNLSGRIPIGNQLQTLNDPTIYAGNRDLCGAPLPNNCSNHENIPTTTSKNKQTDANEPKKVWFYMDIMCGFVTGFWGVIGALLFKKQWRYKLFMIADVTMDKVYEVVAVRVSKIKRAIAT